MGIFLKKNKVNNAGFTLVELVIAVALLAVVGTAVFGFMAVGAKTFSSTSSEVNIQNETQLAFNQMQDIIIDTACGIDYGYVPSGSTAFIPVADESGFPATIGSKNLIMYNLDKVYEISWVPNESKLYYYEYDATIISSNSVEKGAVQVDKALMSEYITDFKVDLSRMLSKRIVRLDLTYSKSGKVYTSSHNITLRNTIISGNGIPPYVVPTTSSEPDRVEGPDSIVLEPGDAFNIGASGLYHVVYTDPAQAPDTNIRYYMVSSPDIENGTGIDSTTGLLEISKGQKEDFQIKLVSNGGTIHQSKVVDVFIMRATSVSINFVSLSASAEDETGQGIANSLVENEEFRLEATINGTHLDEQSVLGVIFDKKSVEWKQESGADNFTLTDNNDGTCICKMKDILNLGDDATLVNNRYYTKAISVSATSKRSIDANKPYMDGGVQKPVKGTWSGYACKKKGDFNIVFDGNGDYKRGEHYPLMVMSKDGPKKLDSLNGIVMPDDETLDITKYVGLIDRRVIETEYKQDGTSVERALSEEEILNSGAEGANVGLYCSYSYNPNATYTYMYTLHLAEKKGGDSGGNVYILPRAGYSQSDYKYSSNTATVTFNRLMLYYNNPDKVSNVFVSPDMCTATYYPRSFNDSNLKGGSQEQRIHITYDYTSEFKEVQNHIKEFRLYRYNTTSKSDIGESGEGFYCLYDDSTRYNLSDVAKSMSVNKEPYDGKNGLEVNFDWQNDKPSWTWKKDTVERVRLVPIFEGRDDAHGISGKEYILFDSYIDIPLWNMEIRNDDTLSKILNLVGLDNPEKTYFPVPGDTNSPVKFPGVTDGKKVWTKPCYGNGYPETLKYTIESMLNSDGSTRYRLTLYAYNKSSTYDEEFATYICDEGDTHWTLQN